MEKSFHFDEVQFTYFCCGLSLWGHLWESITYSMDTKLYCHVSFKIFMILAFAFRFMSDFLLILCWCKVGVQLYSLACSSLAILLKINGASFSQKGFKTQGNPDWVIGSRVKQMRHLTTTWLSTRNLPHHRIRQGAQFSPCHISQRWRSSSHLWTENRFKMLYDVQGCWLSAIMNGRAWSMGFAGFLTACLWHAQGPPSVEGSACREPSPKGCTPR